MSFQFDSFQAFIEMGGHGYFVWTCFGVVLLIMVYLVVSPSLQKKNLFKQLARRQQRMNNVDSESP